MGTSSTPRRSMRGLRAFTLIETMIALVVMLLALLGILAVVPFAFTDVQSNALEVQAVAVGQQYLEEQRDDLLQNIPKPGVTSVAIDPGQSFEGRSGPDEGYGSFTVTPDGCTTVEFPGDAAHGDVATYLCSVKVSWMQGTSSRSVTVQSFVTQ